MNKLKTLAFPALLVGTTLLVMSGACSQHDPGPYEGGGRTAPTTVIGIVTGNGSPPEGGADVTALPDVFVPPPDVFVPPDTGGGG